MQRVKFEQLLFDILQPDKIKDYCPNGLQVQGSEQVNTIITGVTASQALLDAAVAKNADTILVHHGYFWKNESYPITGIKHQRIKTLIANDMNLFAYHLPLDIHPSLGNNAQLAKLLDISIAGPLEKGNEYSVSLQGYLEHEMSADTLSAKISEKLSRQCLHIPSTSNKPIKTIAWCTGGGQGYLEMAAQQGIDAFITGEVSEQTTHLARELDIHFFAAGHHATERYGAKALGEFLNAEYGFDVEFIDIDNPV